MHPLSTVARLDNAATLAREFFARLGVTPHDPDAVRGADGHINVSAEMDGADAVRACAELVGHPMVTGFTYYGADPDRDGRHAVTVFLKRKAVAS